MTGVMPVAPASIDVRVDTLAIQDEIAFNDWRRFGEELFTVEGTVQWYLGDWWAFGQRRFGMDYYPALEEIARAHATLQEYARVARAFPPRRLGEVAHRISEISWSHHHFLASIKDEQERMAWLEDCLRQNWSVRDLRRALDEERAIGRSTPPALSLRLVEDYYRIAVAKAERRGMDPKDWLLEAIRNYDGPAPIEEAA